MLIFTTTPPLSNERQRRLNMKGPSIIAFTVGLCLSSFAGIAQESSNAKPYQDYGHQFNGKCDTNINADLHFSNNELRIITDAKQNILFTQQGTVIVDGKEIDLNQEQQNLAKSYFNDIEQTIPIVASIASEAINITNIALSEVFTALLGENSQVPMMIDERLSAISKGIQDHVYQNPDSITFDTTYLDKDLGLNGDFEREVEEMTEELMATAMGEMLMVLGKAMMSGTGDMDDFEKRMESLSADIETRADALALEIEEKAEVLCDSLLQIDATENQLQNVSELRNLNLIDVSNKKA